MLSYLLYEKQRDIDDGQYQRYYSLDSKYLESPVLGDYIQNNSITEK